ncbi:LysR family transcriptional regulator [Sinorhizobium meliloti]|uniref:helix-turn-helix domain-containing protein n=1 Tax=Rhizobium meliloti TaxID=382 RepID=UPI002E126478
MTHAGRHLGLSQPSVSRALTRLRRTFNNDLLVRGSGGMVPTPHAERLAKVLPTALGFDPRAGESRLCPGRMAVNGKNGNA